MFESSLMESGGQIKTKSKYWMIGTFIFNGAILATMILIPLLYPEALPKTAMTAMLTAPPPPLPLHPLRRRNRSSSRSKWCQRSTQVFTLLRKFQKISRC
ncbi:hypothetical protein [Tunturiibacter empetritectus]|uniref:hypothetical protein n=1 Tax=Tunturiibacter empetritectus TaxID=3069691 RepID=UPI003D9BF097